MRQTKMLIALGLVAAVRLHAQIDIATPGLTLEENFDTLPNTGVQQWLTNSTIVGWYAQNSSSADYDVIISDDGSLTNVNNVMSYGTSGEAERGLGLMKDNHQPNYIGVLFQNNTGQDLTTFDFEFIVEQWRRGLGPSAAVRFQYRVDDAPITSYGLGSWSGDLDWYYDVVQVGDPSPLDGNDPVNQDTIMGTANALVPNGHYIAFRWQHYNTSFSPDNQHGFAIDDFKITPKDYPLVKFAGFSATQAESSGSYQLGIIANNPSALEDSVTVFVSGGTATNGVDFNFPMQNVVIPSQFSDTLWLTVDLLDDCFFESDETILFSLIPAGEGIVQSPDEFNFIIDEDPGDASGGGKFSMFNTTTDPALSWTDVWQRNATNQSIKIAFEADAGITYDKLNVSIPDNWGGLAQGNVSLIGPGFAGANVNVAGGTVTITDIAVTDASIDTIEIIGLTTPNPIGIDVGIDTFAIETGVFGCPASPILNESPNSPFLMKPQALVYVLIPIQNLRSAANADTLICNSFPMIERLNVAVAGRASVDRCKLVNCFGSGKVNIAIQDDTVRNSGVHIFSQSGSDNVKDGLNQFRAFDNLEGDSIIVKGKITIFSCFIEIEPRDEGTHFIHNAGPGVAHPPVVRTLAQLFDDKDAYEGMLVRVNNIAKNNDNPANYSSGTCYPLPGCPCGTSGGGPSCRTMVTDWTTTASDVQMYSHPPSCVGAETLEPCWPIDLVGIWQDYKTSGDPTECEIYGSGPCAEVGEWIEISTRKASDVIPIVHDTIRWTGKGDGVSWKDPFNWCSVVPGPNTIAIVENTGCVWQDINIALDTLVEVKELIVKPRENWTITLTIPDTNLRAPAFVAHSTGDAIVLNENAYLVNESGLTDIDANAIEFAQNGKTILMDGSFYVHKTKSSDFSLIKSLNADSLSTVVYDVPQVQSTFPMAKSITSPITLGNITFEASSPGPSGYNAYWWQTAFNNIDVQINGSLTVNANAAVISNMAGNSISVVKDIHNNSTADPLAQGTPGIGFFSTLKLIGDSLQTIDGISPVVTLRDLEISNTSYEGIELNTNVHVGEIGSGANADLLLNDGRVTPLGAFMLSVENNDAGSISGYAPPLSPTSDAYVNGLLRRRMGTEGTYDFPVGNDTAFQLAVVEPENSLVEYGLVEFETANPGTAGLPLVDNNALFDNTLNAGYWNVSSIGALGGGTFSLELYSVGHTNGNRTSYGVVYRSDTPDDWEYRGSHLSFFENPGIPVVLASRSGLQNFGQFAVASSDDCLDLNPAIDPLGSICSNDTILSFSAAPNGGIWSGNGIVDPDEGHFDPTVAGVGSHWIYYDLGGSGLCPNTDSINIVVEQAPNATITAPSDFCVVDTAETLTAADPGGVWNGNGIVDPDMGVFDPSMAGIGSHQVYYEVTSGNCTSIDSATITVNDNPDATIDASGPFCANESPVNLAAITPGGTWSGNGIVDPAQGTFDPADAAIGPNWVYYNVTLGSCVGSDSIEITINDLPTVTIDPLQEVCIDLPSFQLTGGTPAGGDYSGNGVVGQNFDPNVAGAGMHTITYSFEDANGCTNTDETDILVNPLVDATISEVAPLCESDLVLNLQANDEGGNWSGNGITDATAGLFDPAVAGIGVHAISYTIGGDCGIPEDTVSITVNENPFATINEDVLPTGSTIELNAPAGVTYDWSPSEGLSCSSCINPVATPEFSTLYFVTVTNTFGCKALDSVWVDVENLLFVPTIFSPNGDNRNDFLEIRGGGVLEFELFIYDRWGNQVFDTKDYNNFWDGTKNGGDPVSEGVYVYYLRALLQNGLRVEEKGDITLLR